MNRPNSAISLEKTAARMSWELQLFEPPPDDALYSIEAASLLANVPRRQIVIFCKYNLLSPVTGASTNGYHFSGTAIRLLRRIEALRTICGDDFAGMRIILELSAAVERLRSEIMALKEKRETEPTAF